MRSAPLTPERLYWDQGQTLVAGVDEVGCGCWAGDVYAAAVILSPLGPHPKAQDSKQLRATEREHLAETIKRQSVTWAIGIASVEEIDRLNIRAAAFLAMHRALAQLAPAPQQLLCDGFHLPGATVPCLRLIGGDHRSRSIAAASILAKVARDQAMTELEKIYPLYGFGKHKGYGTRMHAAALKRHGPTPLHRQSFAPVRACLYQSVVNSN